jgi:putative hydrolase of HD superfamily
MHRLRFDRPGWGAQLEKLVESGTLSLEEASQQLKAASSAVPAQTKRVKSEEHSKPVASDGLTLGRYVGDLKRVPRTGWVLRKVPERIESVAEHSFRAAVLGLFLQDDTLNVHTVVSMALLHDLAESIAGDIAPNQGVNDDDKHKMETDAMNSIMSQLAEPQKYARVMELWEEYEARETKEGKAVKDLDRFEMILQANEYEERNPGTDLSEFYDSVRNKLTHPTVIAWFQEVEKRRNERIAARKEG